MTNKKKNKSEKVMKLFKAFGSKEDKFKQFRTLGIVATNKCNLNCAFCIWNKKPKDKNREIDLNLFEKILIEAKQFGYADVQLTGGEVCLHSQFKELISLIVKYDFQFTFVSNCILWERYKFIVENPETKRKLNSVAFSLDGTKETHEKFRGVGSYDKVIEAVKYFKENKISVTLKMAVGSHNFKEIFDVIKIAYDLGVDVEIFSITCMPNFTLKGNHVQEFYKMINENDEFLLKCKDKISILFDILEINGWDFCCNFKTRSIEVQPDGKAAFCCGMDYEPFIIGDLHTDTFQQILLRKFAKTKQIVNFVMDCQLDPLLLNTVIQDKCSFCKFALGCRHNPQEIAFVYPEEVAQYVKD